MTQACRSCNHENQAGARFCMHCGATLAATVVQCRTVVAPPSMAAMRLSSGQVDTIVKRAQSAFGNQSASILSVTQPGLAAGQRELTIYVLDVSGSMGEPFDARLTKMQAAIRAGIRLILCKAKIDAKDEVGLVVFEDHGTALVPVVPLHSQKSQLIEALQSLSPGQGTDIDSGLDTARAMFDWDRENVVRRIVLLTDGEGGDPLDTAADLKSRGVIIDVIGIGDCPQNVDEKLLRKVASTVKGELRYKFIKDNPTIIQTITDWAGKTQTV